MDKRELVLAALAVAPGAVFTPVQVQKLFFLIDENAASLIGGKHFSFQPNDYGPFDADVYRQIESLAVEGLAAVSVNPNTRFKTFRLSPEGVQAGNEILSRTDAAVTDYFSRLVSWIRSLSFKELVTSIYDKYPEMKARSIFKEEA